MSSATIPRTNSRSRSNNRRGRSSGTSSGRNSAASTPGGRRSRGNSLGSGIHAPPELDFNGLQATIAVMDPHDEEYEDTCLIFLSSRYPQVGPFHRQYKDAQVISRDQWVEYWTSTVEEDKRINAAVAAKMYDTCTCLAKGRSGVTPTVIDNLQKCLPRKFRSVTSTGASRQLSRFSWYANSQTSRDITRPSQVLTPQKYEELIARLQAEVQSARDELSRAQRSWRSEKQQLEAKLEKARTVVSRLKGELASRS